MRAIWKGDISFGLVAIPVGIVSAEVDKELHFHLLDSRDSNRVRYKRVNSVTGKEVEWKDIVKGFEFDKDQYIIVDNDAFEKASPELFKTIAIEEFVELKQIDTLFLQKPYYLVPESKNKKAYVLLREALHKTNKVGVAKIIIRSKESLSIIMAHDKALLLYLVHFEEELKDETDMNLPSESLKNYKIADRELKMAVGLIQEMTTKWDPSKYHNDYREALRKWLDKKSTEASQAPKNKNKNKKKSASTRKDEVIDFIALLKESMTKKKSTKRKPKTA